MVGSNVGPYRVLCKLGEGGMGTVYEAVHEAIERRVALKVLHAQYAANTELARRFFNEARAVNRVDHPGLVQISDFGHLLDNTAYIVMELLKGETLGARLRQLGKPMPLMEVLCIGREVADALAAAHAKSVVHRDLKPDNVMIIPDPYMQRRERTKLLDFGIAKLDTSKDSAQLKTRTNALIGTPAYMSPEQCRGAGQVDGKSDVYSFGVLLYTMLTGKPPFTGTGLGEIIGKHLYEDAPPLASRAPWVPESIIGLVHSLLRKDKDQRPEMRQVASELETLLEQHSTQHMKPIHAAETTPISRLADNRQLVAQLSTLAASSGPAQDGVKSWRHLLLKTAALCTMGIVCGFGLPSLPNILATQRTPSLTASAGAIIGSETLPTANIQNPPRKTPTEHPAAAAPSQANHQLAIQPTWTGPGEAPRLTRKKIITESPSAIAPAKHSARLAHPRPEIEE